MSRRSKKQQAAKTAPHYTSEELYQTLFEQAADGIFIADAQGRFIEVNLCGCEMLGYTREEILDLSIEDLIPPEDLTDNPIRLDDLRAGKTVLKERQLRGKDGHLLPVEINARMLADGNLLGIVRDITERKQAEDKLRQTTEELQQIMASISDCLWSAEVDEEGNWTYHYYSPVVEKITGRPSAFYLNKPQRWLNIIHPDDRPRLFDTFQRILSGQPEREEGEEYRIVRPDGTICWIRDRAVVMQLGTRRRIYRIISDITEHKQAEEALQKSHEELRAFFSQTIDGCFFMMLDEPVRWDETTDKEEVLDYVFVHQHITQLNEAMLAQYDATGEQMLNLTPNDFFQHNLAHGRDLWRQLFDAGKIRLESDERKLDGTPMWIEGEYIVLYDSEGRITGHFGIQRDVTERKRTEEELQQSNDLLRAIIKAAPTAIIGLDLEGNVQMVWNPAAEKMLGWSAQEAMGHPLPSVPVENQEEFRGFRERIRSGLTLDGVEVHRQKRDGTPIDYSIYASPLYDAEGRITGNVAVLADITERKQAEQSIALMNFALDNVHEAAFLVDENPRLHYVNEEACRILGYTREELLDLSIVEVNPDLTAEHWSSHWDELKTRQSLTFEGHHKTKDGRLIPVEINANYFEYEGQSYSLGLVRDITKRKRAEETLREKQNQLLEAQHIAHIGNWWHDLVTGEIYWSDEFFRIIGREPQKPTVELAVAITHPDDWHIVQHAMDEAAAGKAELEHEFRIIRPDGGIRWIHNRWVGIYDEAGKEIKRIGTHQDITERKRAEEERQTHLRFLESMDQINRAIQSTNDLDQMMSDVLDLVLSTLECDRAYLLYPCDPNAATWQVPIERNKPEYPGALEMGLEMPMDADVAESLRLLLAADGPVKFGPGTSHPLPADVAEQFGFKCFMSMALHPKVGKPWQFGIHQCSYARIWTAEEERLFQEIGRRLADALTSLLAYRNLQESEERYRLIAENTADTISVFDLNLKPIYVSPSVLKLRGYTVEEAMAQPLEQVLTPESLQIANKVLAKQMALEASGKVNPGRTVLLELEEYCKDGSTIWIELAASFLRDNDLKPIGILTVTRDITERKRAEEEVHRLNQELEQRVLDRTAQLEAANKELEAFAYSVSHDLRAPLRHIDGFLELLQQSLTAPLDERSRGYMTNIADAVGRMGTLIDDLLSFSRMGRYEMSRTSVDLNVLTQEIIQEFAPETQDRTINWHIADLPAVNGDRAMLRVTLVNLIANALKFTRGRTPTDIEIGCQTGEKETVVFVRDNGAGFDMAYADKLFGVFQRLHRADEFEGVGIGLANVRRIINRHGGHTWAEGETDHGATFYFSLPQSIQKK